MHFLLSQRCDIDCIMPCPGAFDFYDEVEEGPSLDSRDLEDDGIRSRSSSDHDEAAESKEKEAKPDHTHEANLKSMRRLMSEGSSNSNAGELDEGPDQKATERNDEMLRRSCRIAEDKIVTRIAGIIEAHQKIWIRDIVGNALAELEDSVLS